MKVFTFLIFAVSFANFGATPTHSQNVFFNSAAFLMPADEADELVKAGYELYRQKKYDEAIAKFQRAIELKPQDFRPYALSGFTYMEQEKFKSASDSFAKAIELKPADKNLYLYKAKADDLRGEKEAAIAACRKALEIDPSFAEAYMQIGETLQYDEKRRDEAEAAYRAAVKADPNIVFAFVRLGNILLYNKKDEKGAEENFRKAIKLDANQMAGRYDLGQMLIKQGRLKEARQLWEGRTTDKDNLFPNFVVILERAERLQRATDALAKKPDDPQTLLEMGNAVMEGDSWVVDGRQERAIVHFRKALKVKPDFIAAQYALSKAYVQIAYTYKDENKNADEELAKLKLMDSKLAKELEDYRKNYSSGLSALPSVKLSQ